MKSKINPIFISFFCIHFVFLMGFFLYNFDYIAYGKIDFTRETLLTIDNNEEIRPFDVTDDEKAEQVPVLMYHRIIDDEELMTNHYNEAGELHGTIVTVEQFEEQMELLDEKGYQTLTMNEFQAFMEQDIDIPKNSVLITFDDGFKDNYINAYPILKKYDFNATIFLISGRVDRNPRDYDPADAQFLSVEEIYQSTDVFSYYGHTHHYHERDGEGVAYLVSKERADITADIQRNFEIIGHHQAFAYPFGEYNDETLEILQELEVDMAFTIKDGMAKPGQSLLEIPRRGIYPGTTIDIFEKLITFE